MNKKDITITQLFDLSQTMAAELFEGHTYPWEVLPKISAFILQLGSTLSEDYVLQGENIWIHKTAKVAPSAYIQGPVIVGKEAEIRHCAFIRGNAIIGEKAVVGNSTEIKNAILFNKVQVPHYNYVGDSILGYCVHIGGAGLASNLKSDKSLVTIKTEDGVVETGLKKVGAMIGDYAEIGASAVLNPGTIIGRNSNVYPLSMVRGTVSANSIYKKAGEIVEKH